MDEMAMTRPSLLGGRSFLVGREDGEGLEE